MRSQYSYPARIERDEEGRYQVRFVDLPDALTDGADPAEALTEAADCLSAAIASRIIDGEAIPEPSPPAPGQRLVSPDPTIALKAALYAALRRRDMTVADLADLLGMGDWHQAARLIDPKRSTKLTTLMAALDALRCEVEIAINDVFVPDDGSRSSAVPPAGGDAVLQGGSFRALGPTGGGGSFGGGAALQVGSFRALGPTGGSSAAGRGTRSALLLPVATPQSPSRAEPGRAEPGGRSRRKAKARSSE